jgi:hypothetical protein
MNFGNVARVLTVAAACAAALGSASSTSNNGPAQAQYSQNSPPPPQQMDSARALGLWRSTFGAVKIEADNAHGGIQAGALQGVWMYQRQGQDVIGYFYGTLSGNVLKFSWQEPNNPPLTGQGYIVFEQTGRQYSGRWWSDKHDRVGDWNGWRQADGSQQQQPENAGYGQPYGGAQYGAQQPYPQQPQQYPPQQQYPQQYSPQQPQQYPPQQQYPQQQYPQQQNPQQPPQQTYPPQQQYPQQPPQQQYPQQPPPQQQPYYPQGQRT